MRKRAWGITGVVIAFALFAFITGCSGGGESNPAIPIMADLQRDADSSRVLWGYYEFDIDPAKNTIDILPLRQASLRLNALKFIETPTSTQVTIESPPKISGGIVTVDISLTHPYPNPIFTGFDVRGILISRGSLEFGDGILPGVDDFHLINSDGYTRFWNPTEFMGKGYQDGILGVPYSAGQYNATVNGFKYFAQDLDKDTPLYEFDNPWRGAFFAGFKNIRTYEIKIGNAGFKFNYAVDASWAMPAHDPPSVPGDFDVNKANCKEAWLIVPRFQSMLTPGGGECDVEADIYDWQGAATIDKVCIEAPDFFDGVIQLTDPVNNGDYITYSGHFTNDNGASGGDIPILISALDTAAASNPNLEAFYLAYLSTGNVVITLQEDMAYKTPCTDYKFGQRGYELSTQVEPFDYLDTNGPWDFTGFTPQSNIHRRIYSPDHPDVADFVSEFPLGVARFVRDPGSDGFVYRAEEHSELQNAVLLHGMYSLEDFQGAVNYEPPAVYPFPYDINTDFTESKQHEVLPGYLWVQFDYHIKAIGQGWAKAPFDGGAWHNCLYVRTTVDLITGGELGEGWQGTLLYLEWIADNGTVVGQVLTGNDIDGGFNFSPDTFEIYGTATFMALSEVTTF